MSDGNVLAKRDRSLLATDREQSALFKGQYREFFRRIRVISFMSVFLALLIGGGSGLVLDLLLDKKPLWTIIGLVAGLVIANLLAVILSRHELKKGQVKL